MRFFFDFLRDRDLPDFTPALVDYHVHIQSTPSTTWTITHNQNGFVYFQAFNASDNWVQPSSAVVIDLDTIQLTFPVAIAGFCYSMSDAANTIVEAAPLATWTLDHGTGVIRAACVWKNNTDYVVPSTEVNNTVNRVELTFPTAISGTVVLIDADASGVMDSNNPFEFIHSKHRSVVAWLQDTSDTRYYPSEFNIADENQVDATFPASVAGDTILASHGG